MTKKLCVVTSSRADYGLLYWLMKEIKSNDKFKLLTIVSGMHLSSQYGKSIDEIKKDGFKVDFEVDMLLSDDSRTSIIKSIGIGIIGFNEAFSRLKPDFIILLGDRYEIFACAQSAFVRNIPIVHLHGGERSEGSQDEIFRHCITKMSYLHFTSNNEYKKRVIQLGEDPKRVFNYGAMFLDGFLNIKFLSKSNLEKEIGFQLNKTTILFTYHPETLNSHSETRSISEILSALNDLSELKIIFTSTNSDIGRGIIDNKIRKFVNANKERCIYFKNLGQKLYLSTLKNVDGVVGNSSSGIIEAPYFNVGTVNIGSRQNGRIKSKSVINCNADKNGVIKSIKKIISSDFKKKISSQKKLFGSKSVSKKILNVLDRCSSDDILRKTFFDI